MTVHKYMCRVVDIRYHGPVAIVHSYSKGTETSNVLLCTSVASVWLEGVSTHCDVCSTGLSGRVWMS